MMIKNFSFWFLLVVAAVLLSCRPAHADGTVAGYPFVSGVNTVNVCSSIFASGYGVTTIITDTGYGVFTSIYTSANVPSGWIWANNCPIVSGRPAFTAYYNVSASSCPVNSTLSGGVCTCNANYQPNSGATSCVAAATCPASGTISQAGLVDTGTTPGAIYSFGQGTFCKSGCSIHAALTIPSSSAERFAMGSADALVLTISGVRHYYVWIDYYSDGVQGSCSAGANTVPSGSAQQPTELCASGQSSVMMNGVLKCFNSDGTAAQVNSASSVAAASARLASDAAAAASVASAVAGASAGSTAAGVVAAQGGTGGNSNNPYPPSDPLHSFCNDNPQSSMCQAKTACEKNPNLAACAELDSAPAAETVPTQTPTFSTASLTFASSAGCPADITFVIGGSLTAIAGTYHLAFTPICNVMATLRPIFLALAAISAAFIFAAGLTL